MLRIRKEDQTFIISFYIPGFLLFFRDYFNLRRKYREKVRELEGKIESAYQEAGQYKLALGESEAKRRDMKNSKNKRLFVGASGIEIIDAYSFGPVCNVVYPDVQKQYHRKELHQKISDTEYIYTQMYIESGLLQVCHEDYFRKYESAAFAAYSEFREVPITSTSSGVSIEDINCSNPF